MSKLVIDKKGQSTANGKYAVTMLALIYIARPLAAALVLLSMVLFAPDKIEFDSAFELLKGSLTEGQATQPALEGPK